MDQINDAKINGRMGENNPVVLVIDDDEVTCKVLEKLLQKEKFTIVTAGNGMDGIELARSTRPDIVLLDIFMPGEDGFETLGRMKKDSDIKSIPVLIFSIIEDEARRKKAMDLGAAGYIPKPFDMRKMVTKIKGIFEKQG
ncbi:MAG: response regulator [Desulfamplus sp.]|nr:response regulator [Desulfamplus sp.]